MTEKEKLLKLALRVEALSGPDREIDCLIWCHVRGITPEWQGNCLVAGAEGVIGWIDPGEHQRNFSCNRADQGVGGIKAYTASLDAAMALIPVDHEWMVNWCGNSCATVAELPDGGDHQGHAATPALALTTAALRAQASMKGGEHGR